MKILYPLNRAKYITQKFGNNPSYYSQFTIGGVPLKGHEGIDCRASNGTEVVACDDGYVQETTDQGTKGYGRNIKIIHSWGESVYAHLQEFKVYQGLQVKKGQVIALSDNTGNSSASHLHFGIRINPYNKSDGWGGFSDPEPHFSEEVVEVINDQTKLPIGGEWGTMELQAVRSVLNDQKRTLVDLQNQVEKLRIEVAELKSNVEVPKEPVFSNSLAKLLYQVAKQLG